MANVVLNLTAAQLTALLDHLNAGGVPNAPDFTYEQTPEGLLLKQGDAVIARQHQDGTWIRESVTTGVGSFHLGEAHSVSSCGQNVGFMNEFSESSDDRVFWFPIWQGLSKDGNVQKDPTALKFSALTNYDVNGAATPINPNIPYNFSTTIAANMAVTKIQVIPNESYTGKLTNLIISGGAEVYRTEVNVACIAGQGLTINYKYPFFTRAGDVLTLQLIKEDGSYLLTWSGASNTAVPYRKLYGRQFSDMSLLPAIDGSRPDSAVSIADADRFLHNDNGAMKQTSFTRVWAWIIGKITGAISGIATSNLTANRLVVTDNSGKLIASTTPADGVVTKGQLKGGTIWYETATAGWNTWFTIDGIRVRGRKSTSMVDTSTCLRFEPINSEDRLWHRSEVLSSSVISIITSTTGTGGLDIVVPSSGGVKSGIVSVGSDDQMYMFNFTIYRRSTDNDIQIRIKAFVGVD